MKENKMKNVAAKLMKKLKDIDLDKVSAITIGIQMSGHTPDKMCPECGRPMSECGCEKDHHIMPDGTKMPGKTHKEYEEMKEKGDYDD